MGLAAWKQAASIYCLQPAPCRQQTIPAHGLNGMSEPCAGARGGQPPCTHLYLIPLSMGWGKSMDTPAPPSQLTLPGQQPRGTSSPAWAEPEQVMERLCIPNSCHGIWDRLCWPAGKKSHMAWQLTGWPLTLPPPARPMPGSIFPPTAAQAPGDAGALGEPAAGKPPMTARPRLSSHACHPREGGRASPWEDAHWCNRELCQRERLQEGPSSPTGLTLFLWPNSIFCPTRVTSDDSLWPHLRGGIQVLLCFPDGPYIARLLLSEVTAKKLHLFP